MADIFISYSKRDAQLTEELARYLHAQGYTTWWDTRLLPADAWDDAIHRQLHDAKAVIVIWSKGSITSKWVRTEASLGVAQNKLITVYDPLIDLRQIPVPFAYQHILPLTERTRILEALAQRGVEPSKAPKTLSKKARIAKAIAETDHEDFRKLIELSGLNPSRHLRFWDWSNLNFGGTDLRGYDFTGALLRNCQFRGARILGARFDKADLAGSNLRAALDWQEYVAAWKPDPNVPADEHLTVGAVFLDAAIGPEMVVLPPGRFWMGSKDGKGDNNERPRHEVTIPYAIAVGRYPVTFEEWDFAQADAEWAEITGMKPRKPWDRHWGRDRRPVIGISWEDAQAYARWLCRKTGQPYRLLSEAEWEYACRAGSEAAYCFGDREAELGDYAWHYGNSGRRTHPVGQKMPNKFGLYDMHGNVLEWCEDVWQDSYEDKLEELQANGGAWTIGDRSWRILRGGSWYCDPTFLRSAGRDKDKADVGDYEYGFRLVRTLSY